MAHGPKKILKLTDLSQLSSACDRRTGMTTTCGSGATPLRFSRENGPSAPTGELPKRWPSLTAPGRIPGRTTFAACLEHLEAERRAARVGAALAGASGPATATPDAPADTARPTTGADDGGDRGFSASEAVPVGADATIDPMVSILFSLAPRAAPASAQVPTPPPAATAAQGLPMEQLMAKLVRRIAWSGNARTGCARLELGAGALDGAMLTIHADDGVVRVALDTPPGVDREAWRERIGERLAARGLHVEAIEIA
jgi:hypothetical protein